MMKKIALFGSAFNPPHLGHLCLIKSAQKHFNFDKVYVIPTGQNPLSPTTSLPAGRLELVQKIFKNWPFVKVEDREIQKKEPSWTINTLKSLMQEEPKARFFIIIGLDQWAQFDQWKHFKSLLKKAHIVIAHRTAVSAGTQRVQEILTPFSSPIATLHQTTPALGKTPGAVITYKLKKNNRIYGRDIYYLSFNVPISSSQVRSLFAKGQPFDHLVPQEVNEWMNQQKKHIHSPSKPEQLSQAIQEILKILQDQKGQRIKVFDLRKEQAFPFDWTVVVSGSNSRHTKAMAQTLKKVLRKKLGLKALHVEGFESGNWVVLDYGDIVLHVFYDYIREHYQLEKLWPPCEQFPPVESKPL